MTRSLPTAHERAPDLAVGATGSPGATAVPGFARWPVLGVAAVVAVVHLAVGSRPRRYFDETLQLAIGRYHLDWGSVDQPPVTPLLAKLADAIAPDSPLALAAPAVLATAGAVVVAALIARELGGDAWAQSLAALAQATGIWVAKVGHWLTPYTLEPVLWLAIAWVLVRWIRLRDDRLLLVLGVVVGIAAQTKFQTMSLCLVLAVCAGVFGPRELLRRPLFWAGAVLAALIAAPTLLWQAAHGWPQLQLSSSIAAATAQGPGRLGVAEGLVTNAGVLGMALGAVGLIALLVSSRMKDHRFLGAAFVVMFVLFVIPPGRVNYLAGAYGTLAAAGAVALQRHAESGRFRWEKVVVWPLLAVAASMAFSGLQRSTAEASPVVADAVTAATARAYRSLTPAERDHTVVLADTFMYASYLDGAPRTLGLPPAASGHVSYGVMPLPSESQHDVLFVGIEPYADLTLATLRPFFAQAREVARLTPDQSARAVYGGRTTTTVWLLRGKQLSWPQLWAAVKTLG